EDETRPRLGHDLAEPVRLPVDQGRIPDWSASAQFRPVANRLWHHVPSRQEVITMTSADDHPEYDAGELPIEQLARRQGIEPITSVDELAQPDLWQSDEEYQEFLADLYASRRAGLA
ncbi:MAG: hypothetical protein L0I76_14960, partial [Pseudonocardia sp.]|nr:hypothetical protein [Pseudonocardia sp.]